VTQKTPAAALASSLLYGITGGNTARALRYVVSQSSETPRERIYQSERRNNPKISSAAAIGRRVADANLKFSSEFSFESQKFF
jgi:hypothetical protein